MHLSTLCCYLRPPDRPFKRLTTSSDSLRDFLRFRGGSIRYVSFFVILTGCFSQRIGYAPYGAFDFSTSNS